MNYISLFSSAGVGCYGFKQSGFECVATNELLEKRLNIQKENKTCSDPKGYILGDISKSETKQKLLDKIYSWQDKNKKQDIDFLIATPPCQGMSVANHKKRNDEIKRNSLVTESIKIVSDIKPRVFVFENVRGFSKTLCIDTDNKEREIGVAIERNLASQYHIENRIINFKDYGSNSSRTRTLIIGTRKDVEDLNPLMLFPDLKKEKTLKQVVGKLPRLNNMGESDINDSLHKFRKYSNHMMSWIINTEYGCSAFDNKNPKFRPHKIVNGEIVENKNKNGDKYKRCIWEKVAPCIHTRNDILASQSTIHPVDNRVFSIRELMLLMTIPKSFKWFKFDTNHDNIDTLIKNNEINIRQSIGEAVPTAIFKNIAIKYKKFIVKKQLPLRQIKLLIEDQQLSNIKKLINFLNKNLDDYSFTDLSKISEIANSKRLKNSAFYTRRDVVFRSIKYIPKITNKEVKILEPSVGVGNFLPDLIKKYESYESVVIDVIDIDPYSIKIAKILIRKIKIPKHIKLNFINDDFLLHNFKNKKYDIVVGNPPFGKVLDTSLKSTYKENLFNTGTNNIFSFFMEKALQISSYISLIIPKSILSSPEFEKTRILLETRKFISIYDHGEKGFKGVKIETISVLFSNKKTIDKDLIILESAITKEYSTKKQSYILDSSLPIWLLYRNHTFDATFIKLKVDIFKYFRDRQITRKDLSSKGKYQIIKSKNLSMDGSLVNNETNSFFIDDIAKYVVKKFLNKMCIVVPNLSYYPRAAFLPKNSVADGSLAIFETDENITKDDIDYFKSDEFTKYYRIAQNYGTRTLNINRNTTFFWGIRK
jgi:DNA (cytosine-5)-methyltransferase 1